MEVLADRYGKHGLHAPRRVEARARDLIERWALERTRAGGGVKLDVLDRDFGRWLAGREQEFMGLTQTRRAELMVDVFLNAGVSYHYGTTVVSGIELVSGGERNSRSQDAPGERRS